MFGIRKLEGKGNLGFAIESSGGSVYDLTKALNGTAGLTSRKGAIAGFNVEQLLKRIERRPLSGGGEFRTGKTPLRFADGQSEDRPGRGECRRGPHGRFGRRHGADRLGFDPGA